MQRDQHDAQQFWLALLAAVRQAATAGRAEPPLATPDFNERAIADRVLSELADQRGRLFLVIDDLHELHSPDALAQLTRLLTNLPDYAAADVEVFTRTTTFAIMQSLRLDSGPSGPVHP